MAGRFSEVVLVTGGSGFLGQHIVRLLQERDDRVKEIRVLDLIPYVNKLNHEENKSFQCFVGDIVDVASVRDAFIGVDCVIHCAAMVSYEFPPDATALENNNVKGTENVITLCIECNIPRLVYTSTAEVTLVPYIKGTFTPFIINLTESKAVTPSEESSLIFPGYPASKMRGEKLVLDADNRSIVHGTGTLRTIALRPTMLYGEEDHLLLPSLLRCAQWYDGRTFVRFAGVGGKQQHTYVGNAAWSHIRAKDTLLDNPGAIAGLPVFITDDTPPQDLLRFASMILSKGDSSTKYRISSWYIPVLLAYFIASIIEVVVSVVLRSRLKLPLSPRGAISYLSSIIFFNRLRADIHLKYSPIFSVEEALLLARQYYLRGKMLQMNDGASINSEAELK